MHSSRDTADKMAKRRRRIGDESNADAPAILQTERRVAE
jgi:hypothetical protein